jgi:glycosyltransferase involved in cell wall biosynthesis
MKYLAACLHVRDEQDILLEWMAFHLSVGFEHLIIIDNGSRDRTPEIIRNFIDQNSVTYLFQPSGNPTEFVTTTIKTFGQNFRWMAFIDADEFLYPSEGGDIRHVLSGFEDVSGVGVYWHTYGSSGHIEKPAGLTIENMTRRANSDFIKNKHVKSIVNPRNVIMPLGSHICKLAGSFVDEKRRPLHDGPPHGFYEEMSPSHQILRINHYHVRSRAQYIEKSKRGYFGMHDDKISELTGSLDMMWREHDMNDVFDDSAKKYIPLMRHYMRED